MSWRPLTIGDLARELGRTPDWLSRHWRELVREKKLPPPLLEGNLLTWDAAQVYAVRDTQLPPAVRVLAAAIRAAYDAAHIAPGEARYADEVAESRRRIDARFTASREVTE